jgi:hypothetical protein
VPFGSVIATVDDAVGGDEDHPEAAPQTTGPRPRHYCHLHNGDPERYPIDPAQTLNGDFYWDGIIRDDAYYKNPEGDRAGADDPAAGQDHPQNGQGNTGPFPNPMPWQPGQTAPAQENPGQNLPGSTPGPVEQPPAGDGQTAPPAEESTRPSWLPPL